MKTKRLISTITYNTDLFLGCKMQELCRSNVIEWGHWIRHQPENDETKSHFHLILQPARSLDTFALSAQFQEPDTTKDGLFLGCMPWRFSKLTDWLLYSIHDAAYLGTKGLVRDHHYLIQDVCSTHPDMLMEDYKQIDLASYGIGTFLKDAVAHGRTWENVMMTGVVPKSHWRYWKEVFSAMGGTFRVQLQM